MTTEPRTWHVLHFSKGWEEAQGAESGPAGTPEAQGKAELLMAVISSINKWQGYTVGASRPVLYVAGSLSKHRKIIHEVLPFAQLPSMQSFPDCI